jgi:hypothetical protein
VKRIAKETMKKRTPLALAALSAASIAFLGLSPAIGAAGDPPVQRLAGKDRYATSAAVSAEHFAPGVARVYLTSGTDANIVDALAANAGAAKTASPVLVVPPTGTLPSSIAKELGRLAPGRIVVVGGVISDAMVAQAVRAANVSTTTTGTSGTTRTGFVTGYSTSDNDPAWSKAIAYSSDWDSRTIHREGGGIGTYEDPVTLAAQVGDYAPGTRFYVPHVDRYFMLEDTCASCGDKPEWVDLFIGGEVGDDEAKLDSCMASLTGTYSFEVNPPPGRHVVAGPLFNSATDTCYTPTP